jgi:hypothetical protein
MNAVKQAVKDRLRVVNRVADVGGNDDGPPVVHLSSSSGIGLAWITGQAFDQGTIELDVRGKDIFQKSFVGIAFHGVDDTSYEAVYLRPFNFRAADPDRKRHAVQYMAMPDHDWPRLRKDHPDHYEKPVASEPDPAEWVHVKMEITRDKIRVFVDQDKTPDLEVKPLVQRNGTMIGYWVGQDSEGKWKNLVLRPGP